MEPIHVKLDYPYDYQGELHEEMVVSRRPRVSDQLAAGRSGKDAATQEIALLANLCGVAPAALHEMDMADYGKLQKVLQTFFVIEDSDLPGLIMELALYTHWSRSEILALETDELMESLYWARKLSRVGME